MTITSEQKAAEIKADFEAFIKKHKLEWSIEDSGRGTRRLEFSWRAVYTEDYQTELEYGSVFIDSWGRYNSLD